MFKRVSEPEINAFNAMIKIRLDRHFQQRQKKSVNGPLSIFANYKRTTIKHNALFDFFSAIHAHH